MADNTLASKNALIKELYDDVDTISEELIDDNYPQVRKTIDDLSRKLRDLKTNITKDEV